MSFGTELVSLGVGQARVHCNNCGTDLTALIHITCAECADFDLCHQCFSSGAEVGNHKNHHAFTVLDNCTFPVLVSDWGADEELLLLEAVEQHGIGNWHEIADAVGSKTSQEAKEHFEKVNLETFGSYFIPADFHKSFMEDTGGAPISIADEQSPLNPVNMTMEEAKMLGYWPKRDDHDCEYLPDAEALISYLDVSFSDEGLEKELKLEQVAMYNDQLIERVHYKRVAKDHCLFPSLQATAPKKKKFKREEKDLHQLGPVISRFMGPKEYEKLLESLAKERTMQGQIADLIRYRTMGITTLTDCARYEEQALQREVSKTSDANVAMASDSKASDSRSSSETSPTKPATSRSTPTKAQTSRKLRAVIHLSKSSHLKRGKDAKDDSNMSSAASYLSQNERRLCSGLGMTATEYITAKAIIIKDSTVRKFGTRAKLKHLPLTSQQKCALIMFFKGHGWV